MQVYGTSMLAAVVRAPSLRRSNGATFTVTAESAQPAATTGGARSLSGIDTLLVLQELEDSTERRRKAAKRARSALDRLDELKLGLLSGTLDPATLQRLQASMAELNGDSGDPRLDGVIAEIALRVGVELAKAGIR